MKDYLMRFFKTSFLMVGYTSVALANVTLQNEASTSIEYAIHAYGPAYVCIKAPCDAPLQCLNEINQGTLKGYESKTFSRNEIPMEDQQAFCVTFKNEAASSHLEALVNESNCHISLGMTSTATLVTTPRTCGVNSK